MFQQYWPMRLHSGQIFKRNSSSTCAYVRIMWYHTCYFINRSRSRSMSGRSHKILHAGTCDTCFMGHFIQRFQRWSSFSHLEQAKVKVRSRSGQSRSNFNVDISKSKCHLFDSVFSLWIQWWYFFVYCMKLPKNCITKIWGSQLEQFGAHLGIKNTQIYSKFGR